MNKSQPDTFIDHTDWHSICKAHRFSHQAMATTFEIFIVYNDARYAEQAAWAAFDELDRLEVELSRFIENSDVSRINNLTVNQPLQIGLDTFECLERSVRIHTDTVGAFDVTIGPLLDCWFDKDETGKVPSEEQLSLAHKCTGMNLIKLNEDEHTVELSADGVRIDLGGIGKGYAIDKMAELLNEWSVNTALIHSGHSTVLAVGNPPGAKGWPVTLNNPANRRQSLAHLYLQDRAVSGSGLQKGRHIIDPITAQPVEDKSAGWACAPDAATADALSTAFMVMPPEQVEQYCLNHPGTLAMLITEHRGEEAARERILRYGQWEADLSQ